MSQNPTTSPPAYSAAIGAPGDNKDGSGSAHHAQQQPIINPNSTTYHLRNHVSSLPSRVRDSNSTRAVRHASEDSVLLETVLVPHVEAFLAELGLLPEHPPSATLVLYPAAATLAGKSFDTISSYGEEARGKGYGGQATPQEPKLSGLDDMQRHGEFVRVQGVESVSSQAACQSSDKKASGPGAGDGRGLLWWKDEAMARRLAAYLQPKPEEDPNLAPPAFFDADAARHEQQQQQQQDQKKQKDKKSWGFKRLMGSSSSSSASSVSRPPQPQPQPQRGYAVRSVDASELDTRARMTVKAEEMTFRAENDMGLFQSFNGYALVARVDFVPA